MPDNTSPWIWKGVTATFQVADTPFHIYIYVQNEILQITWEQYRTK